MDINVIGLAEEFENIYMSYEEICDAERATSLNTIVSEYLYKIYYERSEWSCLNESQRVHDCCTVWYVDHYTRAKISDVKYVSHCRNKFCLNCQKLLQASRLNRFVPQLLKTAENYDLYHVVLTVSNIPGVKLKTYCTKLLPYAFRRFIRILRGKDKITGLDFSKYGYYAALRSLEVTYGKRSDDDYHPHYHCIFALKKGLVFKKTHKNVYSYKDGVLTDYFSDFEILLQKLWRLIIDSEYAHAYNSVAMRDKLGKPLSKTHPDYGKFVPNPKKPKCKQKRVTLEAVEALKLGYSVKMDLISDDEKENRNTFIEVFKYVCKCTSEESKLFTYEQFFALYHALKGVHSMRGYGAWSRFDFDKEDDSINEFYSVYMSYIRQHESPVFQQLSLTDVKKQIENKETVFITKRTFRKWFRSLDEISLDNFKASLDDVQPVQPSKARYYNAGFAVAYLRYLEVKRTSDLFADIREREQKAKEAKSSLTFSPEQLSFLDTIF